MGGGEIEKVMHTFPHDMQWLFPALLRQLKARDQPHGTSFYLNRAEAGRLLAEKLEKYAGRDDVIVLGLPAAACGCLRSGQTPGVPLDVFIVRKLGVPGLKSWPRGRSLPAVCAF